MVDKTASTFDMTAQGVENNARNSFFEELELRLAKETDPTVGAIQEFINSRGTVDDITMLMNNIESKVDLGDFDSSHLEEALRSNPSLNTEIRTAITRHVNESTKGIKSARSHVTQRDLQRGKESLALMRKTPLPQSPFAAVVDYRTHIINARRALKAQQLLALSEITANIDNKKIG